MEILNAEQTSQESLLFQKVAETNHEQVVFCNDKATGLKAIIALHNTTLGPGLGGCRMYPYSNEQEAITDVLRLSKGMTYKASISGLNLGGGKSVIIGDPQSIKSEGLFRKFGQYIQSLSGQYITAEDVGTTTKDMEYIKMETNHVVGLPKVYGGGGDPSPVTAYGVYLGIKASAKHLYGNEDLANKKVLVEGVGKVGMHLLDHLNKENAEIFVSDINDKNLNQATNDYGAKVVAPENIASADVDIYAPCAMGATLNDETIPQMKASIVAGAANNQLADENIHSSILHEKGILYAPDYLINAGGLINVYTEWNGYHQESAMQITERIYDVTSNLMQKARDENITTTEAANRMAEERIQNIGMLNINY